MTLVKMDRHGNVKPVRAQGRKQRPRWIDREVDRYRAGLLTLEGLGEAVLSELGWKYDESQPRVPAGSPEGGQWTSGGAARDFGDTPRSSVRWQQTDEEKQLLAWGKEHWSPYSQGVSMSPSEERRVTGYMTRDYHNINKALRSGETLTAAQKRTMKALDKVMTGTSAPEDVYVYRALRGELKPGTVVEDSAYPSTTLVRSVAREFVEAGASVGRPRRIARILVPRGARSAFIAGYGPDKGTQLQQEVLLPRGTRFRILSVTADGVEMEVVP